MSPGLSKNPYFNQDQFSYREIVSATPYKKHPLQLLKALGSLFCGTVQSLRHLGKIKPKLVVGFGSFHSFPVILAAKLRRIPIILFESNAAPGKVNRLCSRWSKLTAVHLLCAAKYLKGQTVCVQMPLIKKNQEVCRDKAREYFKLDKDKLTFLVFGGSQGAHTINRFFCASLEKLISNGHSFQVVHIVGNPDRAEILRDIYAKHNISASVKPFEEKMNLAWVAADLSISRAGAATLAEQIKFTTPGIHIPYLGATENHQEKNAAFIAEEIKGGVKLSEKELSVERLISTIEELLPKLNIMKQSLKDFKDSQESKDLCSVVFDFLSSCRH